MRFQVDSSGNSLALPKHSLAVRVAVLGLILATFLFSAVPVRAEDEPLAQNAASSSQLVPLEDVVAAWPQLDERNKLITIEQIIKAGHFDAAEDLLGKTQPTSDAGRRHTLFLLGVLRKAQGEVDEAIGIFRKILVSNPELQRVRLELAHALFLKQEDASAKHHFELVMGSATNPDLQRTVASFIDAMDKRRSWHASGYFSMAPSTNINQATDAKFVTLNGLQFKIDETSRGQSGVGINTGGTIGYRLPLSDRLDLVAGGGVHLRRYQEDAFNDTIVTAELGPRYRLSFGDIAIYATATRRWYGGGEYSLIYGDGYAWLFGARTQATFRLGPKDILRAGASCHRKKHDSATYLDGYSCSVNMSEDYFLDTSSFLRVLGGTDIERSHVAHSEYNSGHMGIGYFRELPWGVSAYSQIKVSRYSFNGVYPSSVDSRADTRLDLSVQLTKRDWEIFDLAPMLQYTYTHNQSNIGFHQFDAHGVNLTWTKNF